MLRVIGYEAGGLRILLVLVNKMIQVRIDEHAWRWERVVNLGRKGYAVLRLVILGGRGVAGGSVGRLLRVGNGFSFFCYDIMGEWAGLA